MFQPGDRVRVIGGPIPRYFNGEGTFLGYRGVYQQVKPDDAFIKQLGYFVDKYDESFPWEFNKDWTLELIDDTKSYEPEDWS